MGGALLGGGGRMTHKEFLLELLKIRNECDQRASCCNCKWRCSDGLCLFDDLPFDWRLSMLNTGGEND
jgi:hypothetical protein